jgi:hypothetical protein
LSVAKRPIARREVVRKQLNLSEKRFGHGYTFLLGRSDGCRRTLIRRHASCGWMMHAHTITL